MDLHHPVGAFDVHFGEESPWTYSRDSPCRIVDCDVGQGIEVGGDTVIDAKAFRRGEVDNEAPFVVPFLRDHAKWADLDVADRHRREGTEDSPHRALFGEVIADNFWVLEGRRDVVLGSSTGVYGVIIPDPEAVADTVGDVVGEVRVAVVGEGVVPIP